MTRQLIDPALVDSNRYQPPTRLDFTPDSLTDLDSIKTIGFIHTPRARPHPDRPGRYELVEGHRRRAAWILYRPGLPMPCEIAEVTDQALFETMAIENIARRDLSAIERALLLRNYIDQFKATQSAAAKLLGLQSQSAVSHLLSLLELPAPIQSLVAAGQLPERLARRLIPYVHLLGEKKCLAIAQAGQGAPEHAPDRTDEGDRPVIKPESHFLHALIKAVDPIAKHINAAYWPMNWDPKTSADMGGTQMPLPACDSCPFNKVLDYRRYCIRPACFTAKETAWNSQAVARIAKERKLSVAAPDEKVKIVHDLDQARAVLATHSDAIRLVPAPQPKDYGERMRRQQVTGSPTAVIAILSSQADEVLAAAVARQKSKPAVKPQVSYNDRQREYKVVRERAQAALAICATSLMSLMPTQPRTLRLIVETIGGQIGYRGNLDIDKDGLTSKNTPTQLRAWLAEAILDGCNQLTYASKSMDNDLSETREALLAFAYTYKITYPPGWDATLLPAASVIPAAKRAGIQKRTPKKKATKR